MRKGFVSLVESAFQRSESRIATGTKSRDAQREREVELVGRKQGLEGRTGWMAAEPGRLD